MGYDTEIDKALIAHGAWKQRLNDAIVAGTSIFRVEQVQADNQCEFGAWFYRLPAAVRSADALVRIHDLHAKFHAEAARVLALALQGRQQEALQALGPGSRYQTVSGQLALALNVWKASLK